MADAGPSAEGGVSTVSQMSTNPMLNAKLTRLKVQQDVELLSNRVERLRAEERKAKQKVLETKLRGQEIVALQKRNEQLHAAKQLAKQMEEEQLKREMQQQQIKRLEQKKTLKVVYEAMHAAKREDVKLERKIKEENLQMVRSLKQYEIERARQAREAIRKHQLAVSERFEKQRQAHQEFLAQDFINMIAAEDRRREEIENEIAAMEQEERKHIERLRELQEEQRAAYDALEEALAS
ncbi:hypothetical protein AB1Y20_020495 [Prymnesium parvum]|uniref:Meiosis-specific nuclear structural protein 1 n=1 Tax=Prymnesium parvum TaxID=97485 RepID=A0AB34JXK1_PRYPA